MIQTGHPATDTTAEVFVIEQWAVTIKTAMEIEAKPIQ